MTDHISNFKNKAVLRWRFAYGDWRVSIVENKLHLSNEKNSSLNIEIYATMPIIRAEIVEGWESLHYHNKTRVSVLEVEFIQSGTINSELRWTV